MELRKLKSFLAVCRYGNVTRAAESLFISQPALSRQVQDLEEELGCQLLDRSRRQIALTEKGRLFEIRAREMLAIAERMKAELQEDQGALGGLIRVGCVESAAMKLLTEMMEAFRAQHPRVLFEVYSADGDDLRFAIDESRIDMALLLEPVEVAKYLKAALPVTDRWAVALRTADVPEGKTSFSPAELAQMPLILPRRCIVQDEIVSWIGEKGEGLRAAAYHNLPSNALEMVRAGVGNLLCAEGSVTNRQTDGITVLPVSPELSIRHVLIRRKNKDLSRACELFWTAFAERFGAS